MDISLEWIQFLNMYIQTKNRYNEYLVRMTARNTSFYHLYYKINTLLFYAFLVLVKLTRKQVFLCIHFFSIHTLIIQ